MEKLWRIKDLLEWTTQYFADKGLEESRLEADILLAHVLHCDRVHLYANYDRPVDVEERDLYRSFIKRRINGEPLAYIIENKEFMSLSFLVSSAVLIPRPDTELMVETALKLAQTETIHRICDVGTGSGAIAVSLAKNNAEFEVYAVDISGEALEIARKNADNHGVNVHFIQSDLLVQFKELNQRIDLITANLPYIPREIWRKLDTSVRDYEPELALVAGGDGLDLYRKLLLQVDRVLCPEGIILLEIDPRQSQAARQMMSGFEINILQDLAGRDRLVMGRRKKDG